MVIDENLTGHLLLLWQQRGFMDIMTTLTLLAKTEIFQNLPILHAPMPGNRALTMRR